jgi:glycosyltransferase involved in cell wall biosynthesis
VPAAATIALHRARGTWSKDVTRFIVMTPFQKDRMVEAGLPAERIDVRPHFTADPGERREPPSRSRRVVYIGRLSAEKGVADLVAAFLAARTDLELVVIGDGPEADALRAQAAGSMRVRFLGHLDADAVRVELLGARALAFPSLWYETFGLSMIEAMAAGTPVVTSDLGGREHIVGEGCGLLFEAGDRGALATAIEELPDDARIDRMGAAARRRWESRYAPAAALRELETTYACAVESRGATGLLTGSGDAT